MGRWVGVRYLAQLHHIPHVYSPDQQSLLVPILTPWLFPQFWTLGNRAHISFGAFGLLSQKSVTNIYILLIYRHVQCSLEPPFNIDQFCCDFSDSHKKRTHSIPKLNQPFPVWLWRKQLLGDCPISDQVKASKGLQQAPLFL